MDVFLVPIGNDRYELYCEVADVPDEPDEGPPTGFVSGLKYRFRETLAEAERERRRARAARPQERWLARVRARAMRWVAESIAEQRLLWHLRKQPAACLFYPDDLDPSKPVAMLRQQLTRDFDKQRFWLIVDSLGLAAGALLTVIPGPNLLAYYFAFRVVGHYLSLRGARHGLDTVEWRYEPSAPLSELRRAIGLDRAVREERVNDIALRLRLEHLATFFERTA
jgi:hypothetical protein